jgi:hypothetical protein
MRPTAGAGVPLRHEPVPCWQGNRVPIVAFGTPSWNGQHFDVSYCVLSEGTEAAGGLL